MALYKVTKTPLKNLDTNQMLKQGDVIDRKVKDVEEFEKKHGDSYLQRVDEKQEPPVKEK